MSTPSPIDDRLRRAARAGDLDAFEQLVAPHRADLHRYCTLMVGCPLRGLDLTQATLATARTDLAAGDAGELESCSSTRVWLHRLATRACLGRLGEEDR